MAFHRGFRPAVEAVINPEFEIDKRDRRRGTIAAVGGIALVVLTPYVAIVVPISGDWAVVTCYGVGTVLWISYVQLTQTLPPTGSPLRLTVIWAREPTVGERDRFDQSLGRPMILRSKRTPISSERRRQASSFVSHRSTDRYL
ncbi:hypothetical protein [Natrinema sp. SYSU A 869]|uniref:hypothetical protein n=1 Tax=Natrinema sp. SYSU A 869 TaxID=2871694 RepID=UPI001CA443EB|nr:hypothetical protein [Natrinema sp. SYSU A 869]